MATKGPRRARSTGAKPMSRAQRLVPDLEAKLLMLEKLFDTTMDNSGLPAFGATCGIYAFFDFDGEPIYVGQTYEGLRTRIRRHLTNQRTDAVAMHVLDPVEVAAVLVWPFWELATASFDARQDVLQRAEYAVYRQLIEQSPIGAILNEKIPVATDAFDLPASFGGSIVPSDSQTRLMHRDERIARRAETIADLARVIKERNVSVGLRQTLLTQARRLERLAKLRLDEVRGSLSPMELQRETTEQPEDVEGLDE
jgi:hypothetical protein